MRYEPQYISRAMDEAHKFGGDEFRAAQSAAYNKLVTDQNRQHISRVLGRAIFATPDLQALLALIE